jgi:trehalose 6-phosphate synthase
MLTKEDLESVARTKLKDYRFITVSNREPYEHFYKDGRIEWRRSVGGLVTAIDPILQVCGGTWVAWGSSDADRDVVDENDHVAVPPDTNKYTLRRVWLSKEEEDGYYHGLSNQTLWPLCHVVYIRPRFSETDWNYYKKVNELFARAVIEEIGDEKVFVLIHDYHLTLCAKKIKEERPDAPVAQFWHVPWPNPEVFRICPWKLEILDGLLSNDLLGFHIIYHRDNFIKTVGLEMESRIDYERHAVIRKGHATHVRAFPISVDFSSISDLSTSSEFASTREKIKKQHEVEFDFLGVGVDRIDYTKGILEKFHAIDRFLEKYPEYQKKFVYLEVGTPSRIHIHTYYEYMVGVEELVEEINWKYSVKHWEPIVLVKGPIDYSEIIAYYKAADVCIVNSLHDGMNLVAKEFVSSQDVHHAPLILSRFTGSAREFLDAILINPYDAEGVADAIKLALEMPPKEKEKRIKKMREWLAENNIYRWGSNLITELDAVRE